MSESMYQSRVNKLNSDIATLERKLAKEMDTQAKKEREIHRTERSISKNTSASMLRQKQNKINRLRGEITKAQNNIAKLRKDLGSKRKDLFTVEERLNRLQERRQAQVRQLREQFSAPETVEEESKQYDLFIAHASEDKKEIVEPLAHLLADMGLDVWYDDFVLKVGMSLRRSIDQGIANSRRGVVILSHAFFSKQWPQHELDGLTTRQMSGNETFILPVWHGIQNEDVARYSPTLADKFALDTATMDVEGIADAIAEAVPERTGREWRRAENTSNGSEVSSPDSASNLNDEERALYRDLLYRSRSIFEYWYNVAHSYWHEGANAWDNVIDPEDVIENAKSALHYRDLTEIQSQVDAFASDAVVGLLEALADSIRNCQQRVIYEVQRWGVEDPKVQGPLWREIQQGVQDTFSAQNIQATYLDLRKQIRKELSGD